MQKISLILVLCIVKLSENQFTPSTPCPDVFQYDINPLTGDIEGRVLISDIQSGVNVLEIKMIYPYYVINGYAGSLSLIKSTAQVVADLSRGYPVEYRIEFPTTNPLPTLYKIVLNDQIICRNPGNQNGASEIKLTHTLTIPTTIRLSASRPSYSSSNQVVNRNRSPPRRKQQKISTRPPPVQTEPQQPPGTTSTYSCGTTAAQPIKLVFGGQKLQPGTWPWLAPMFGKEKGQFTYLCGTSIIAQHAVITAAHCVISPETLNIRNAQDVVIGLGIYNIFNWREPNTQIAGVNRIISHPEYGQRATHDADIAIIILEKSYNYNSLIRPVCLWSGSKDANSVVNQEGKTGGWGLTAPDGDYASEPTLVTVKIVSDQVCLRSNPAFSSLTSERNLCAGYRNGDGPCKGDSGSGLIIAVNNRWYLRALVSAALFHAETTCNLSEYVIYTDVAQFLDWIRSHVSIT